MFKKAIDWTKLAFSFVKSHLSKKTVAIILSVAVGTAGLVTGGVTLAKYAIDHKNDGLVELSAFYFESNLLKPAAENATYHNGTNSITFELRNYAYEKRKSDLDVQYEVFIKQSNGDPASASGVNTSGNILVADKTVSVTYTGLEYGKTYVVTASSTAPYTKTLSATFVIPTEDQALSPVIEDHGDFVTITVETDNFAGNVTLSWQNGYVPDNSYAPLANASGTSCEVTLESKSTYVFRFYKSVLVENDYVASNFTLRN